MTPRKYKVWVLLTDNAELLPRRPSGEDYMLGLEMTFSLRVRSKWPDYSAPLIFGWRKRDDHC